MAVLLRRPRRPRALAAGRLAEVPARARSPTAASTSPRDELFAIDPHPFHDDGRWYLYYARDVLDADRVGTHLAVAELSDMTALAGTGRPGAGTHGGLAGLPAPAPDVRPGPTTGTPSRGRSVRRHGDRYHCSTPAAPTWTRATASPGRTPTAPTRPLDRTRRRAAAGCWPPSPDTSAGPGTTASSPPRPGTTYSSTTHGTPTAPNVSCTSTPSPGQRTAPPPPAPAGPNRPCPL